ncbi:MAG: autotransporter outer membrane beta-barrel domain-containing protein [Deltaproteobacteria bacterium]|nr:autotransporter outer membrane beta-barrel domain-containing protein [Deltaproteobacteria bacterium]
MTKPSSYFTSGRAAGSKPGPFLSLFGLLALAFWLPGAAQAQSRDVNTGETVLIESGDGDIGSPASKGQNNSLIVPDNLNVLGDSTFDFIKGEDNRGKPSPGQGAAGGNLTITAGLNHTSVDRSVGLHIAEGRTLTMILQGGKFANEYDNPYDDGVDVVHFNTLKLNPGATFETEGAAVGFFGRPGAYNGYQVNNLDLITHGRWLTNGDYSPDNTTTYPQVKNDYIRFDMSNIRPNHLMLNMIEVGYTGQASLENFDPVAQHEAYLDDDNRPQWSDDPGYRPDLVGGESVNPAFLTSVYQTKRLHLGHVTLIDRTDGTFIDPGSTYRGADGNLHYQADSALGDLYSDFAYTAGLRRYYWDVHVVDRDNNIDMPLMAHNYFTADATRVMAQAALAGLLVPVESFQSSTLGALQEAGQRGANETLALGARIAGSRFRHDTGSDVTVNGFFATLTASRSSETGLGLSTLGAFVEYGHGNYDTYSFIPRYGEVFGDGRGRSLGGGLFLTNNFRNGSNLEASFRGGGTRNRYKVNRDPWAAHPGVHAFETNNYYLGAHLGLGHGFKLDDNFGLEPYVKGFWTRSAADSFTTDFGDLVQMEAIDSLRSRLGARLNFAHDNGAVSGYLGAAWEHEFMAESKGLFAGDPITNPPDLKGASLFGELGLNINANENASLNFGLFGLTGQQKGLGGQAMLELKF